MVKQREARAKEIEDLEDKEKLGKLSPQQIAKLRELKAFDIFSSDEETDAPSDPRNSQQLEEARTQLKLSFPAATARLQCIDSVIKKWLSPEAEFRLWMSGIFAGLIGLVIAGFFALAWKDMRVRRAVFAGQVGLQFLALFSIIIAIILFGITKILEARELAALLGSLAGYILGRHTAPGRGEGNSANDEIEEFMNEISKIKISPAKASLDTNKPTEQLNATPTDAKGKAIKPPTADAFTPQWKSSDIAVATVDNSGVVTRKSAGTCNVTAEFNDITSNICVVTCQ